MYTNSGLLLVLCIFLVQTNGGSVVDHVLCKDTISNRDSDKNSIEINKITNIVDRGSEDVKCLTVDMRIETDNLNTKEMNDLSYEDKNIDNKVELNEEMFDISYIEDTNRIDKEESVRRFKRAADLIETKSNVTNMTEGCVGSEEYCNMTKEEYMAMLNDYIYPQTYEWVLIGTHTAVFVIGLVGNALVCIAVYRNHTMRTVTNYFIVNLAVADFMVILFCLPPTVLWDVTETWFLGNVLCKLMLYFQSVSVTVSVLTLTFISVDRWYAICFPLKFKSTTGRAKTAIFIIWTLALLFNSPDLVVLQTVRSVPLRFDLEYLVQCMATWSPTNELIWHVLKALFIYTIPLLLMTVAYYQIVKVLWNNKKIPGQAETIKLAPAEQTQLRSRRKAAKMLVAVVIMFAVCYFPVHLLCLLRYTVDMEQSDAVTFLALVSHVLCYANSAINPLIYNFMSGKFRREFRRLFCCSPGPYTENFSTLTRVTTSKIRQPCVALNYQTQRSPHPYVSTTFIENGYRKGYLS